MFIPASIRMLQGATFCAAKLIIYISSRFQQLFVRSEFYFPHKKSFRSVTRAVEHNLLIGRLGHFPLFVLHPSALFSNARYFCLLAHFFGRHRPR